MQITWGAVIITPCPIELKTVIVELDVTGKSKSRTKLAMCFEPVIRFSGMNAMQYRCRYEELINYCCMLCH